MGIKFKCLADRPWKKCWIYKEFEHELKDENNETITITERLGCKSTHHAGYQVESNCDNGIEWSGSYRVCAVTLLSATKSEDEQWRCMVKEEVFIGKPSFTKDPENLALTINKKTTTEKPKTEKPKTEKPTTN